MEYFVVAAVPDEPGAVNVGPSASRLPPFFQPHTSRCSEPLMTRNTGIWTYIAIAALAQITVAAEPVVITRGTTPNHPRQPQLAIDDQGNIHVAFGAAGAVYYTSSRDGGKSFGDRIEVGQAARLALGMRRGPRIAVSKGAVVMTAIGHEAGNVFAWRSTVGGKSWQGPAPINDSSRDAREGLHTLASSPSGELCCVWLDCRDLPKGQRIFCSTSADGGQTWSANREVYRSP